MSGVVSFQSAATNLVGVLDTNGIQDVFVFDRVALTTERVSISTAAVPGDGTVSYPVISGDGRYVAFGDFSTNLLGVGNDNNGNYDNFVRDLLNDTTARVSVDSADVEQVGGSLESAISYDGRYIAFKSSAANLVAVDSNGKSDIFLHDTLTGITSLVSVDSAAVQANNDSQLPSISGNRRYIVFESSADNLVASDTNTNNDIFVHYVLDGTTVRVDVSSLSVEPGFGAGGSAISADGRYVVFGSADPALVTGDTNADVDVFLRDRGTV